MNIFILFTRLISIILLIGEMLPSRIDLCLFLLNLFNLLLITNLAQNKPLL